MTPRTLPALILSACLSLGLGACSRQAGTDGAEPAPVAAAQAYEVVAAEGKGFSVGPITAARTVYVLFDPQCPHCGHLWQAMLPLLDRVRFVWMPVAFISPKSLPQGAALMQATDPVEAMSAHERSLLAGQGGTSASASVPAELEAAIESNTRLLGRLGADSVPFIVAQPGGGAAPVTHAGAMDRAELAKLIGLN